MIEIKKQIDALAKKLTTIAFEEYWTHEQIQMTGGLHNIKRLESEQQALFARELAVLRPLKKLLEDYLSKLANAAKTTNVTAELTETMKDYVKTCDRYRILGGDIVKQPDVSADPHVCLANEMRAYHEKMLSSARAREQGN